MRNLKDIQTEEACLRQVLEATQNTIQHAEERLKILREEAKDLALQINANLKEQVSSARDSR